MALEFLDLQDASVVPSYEYHIPIVVFNAPGPLYEILSIYPELLYLYMRVKRQDGVAL